MLATDSNSCEGTSVYEEVFCEFETVVRDSVASYMHYQLRSVGLASPGHDSLFAPAC